MRILFLKILYPLLALASFINPYYGLLNYAFISIIRPEQLTYGFVAVRHAFPIAMGCLVLSCLFTGIKVIEVKEKFFLFFWMFLLLLTISTLISPYTIFRDAHGNLPSIGSIMLLKQLFLILIYCTCIYTILIRMEMVYLLRFLTVIVCCFMFMAFWGILQWTQGNTLVEGLIGKAIIDRTSICGVFILYVPPAIYFMTRKGAIAKTFGIVACLSFLAIVIFTQSRGGFLGLCVMAACMFIFLKKSLKFYVLLVVVVIAAILFTPDFYKNRVNQIKMQKIESNEITDYSSASRLFMWAIAIDIFLDHPFLGVGNVNFPVANQEYAPRYLGKVDPRLYAYCFEIPGQRLKAHNTFINILAEGGLLTAIMFYLLLFYPLVKAIKSFKQPDKDDQYDLLFLQKMFVCGILGFLATAFFTNDRYIDYVYWNLAILTVINVKRREMINGNNKLTGIGKEA